jgi:hypothetical protein
MRHKNLKPQGRNRMAGRPRAVRMNGKSMQKIILRWRTLVDGRKERAPFAFLRSGKSERPGGSLTF